jgi:peptidoglycan/LPS O-acetylase OafA/YrhL
MARTPDTIGEPVGAPGDAAAAVTRSEAPRATGGPAAGALIELAPHDLTADDPAVPVARVGSPVGPSARSLPRVRALDGLRGLAVAAVVLYHLDLPWIPGGFLGVSLFFTLSGYLITSLILAEREQQDRLGLRRFWVRRFRRLLPAAWLGIALAIAFALVAGDPDQLRALPGDVVGALADVANWRFILAGSSYTAGYQAPSPLLHYWSLAVEEQFYLVFPLVVALLIARRASIRTWWCVMGAGLVGSLVATELLYDPTTTSRVYFGTVTRIGEVLAGVLLALAVRGWWSGSDTRTIGTVLGGPDRRRSLARDAVPLLALIGVGALWWHTTTEDQWIYRGGLLVVAALSCVLVIGALGRGPMARGLEVRPLVGLGLISYGVYVYHWPLFLWLDHTSLTGWPLDLVKVAATLAVALVSYRWVEQPIRRGELPLGLRRRTAPSAAGSGAASGAGGRTGGGRAAGALPPRVALAGLVVVAVLLVGSAVVLGRHADDRAVAQAASTDAAPLVTQPSVPAAGTAVPSGATSTVPIAPPKRVLFLGDSLLHQAFPVIAARFAAESVDAKAIGGPGQTLLGHQAQWIKDLYQGLEDDDPDVVVIESCCGFGDASDPYLVDGKPVALDSDAMWQAWQQQADRAVTMAEQQGRLVLWVLAPPAQTNGYYGPIESRIGKANDIALGLAAKHPRLGFVDWRIISGPGGEYVSALPDATGKMVTVRAPDGLHFSPAGQGVLADDTRSAVDTAWQQAGGRTPAS